MCRKTPLPTSSSSRPPPRTRVILSVGPEDRTFVRRSLGTLCVASFVVIWLSSLFSPLLLFAAYRFEYLKTFWAMVAICVGSYLPWGEEKGPISRAFQRFYDTYHPYYYERFVYCIEEDDEEDEEDDEMEEKEEEKEEEKKRNDDDDEDGELRRRRTRGSTRNKTTKTINKRTDLSADPQTLYAVHPHGAFSFGWAFLSARSELSRVRFCFSPVLFRSPFFRLFGRLVGRPGSAARNDMREYLARGESLSLPPGGFEEATLTSPVVDRVYVKRRTGFVRLCLERRRSMRRERVELRPVFVFGERDLFRNAQGAWRFRLDVLNRRGIPALCAWGRPLCPLLPRQNRSLRVVVGRPLRLPPPSSTSDDPASPERVRYWHARYVAALTRLYEDHKETAYGAERGKVAKLEVW